ncbi:Ca2+-binding RTX toxin-like protein [Aliiruegeria haliotis]|uniref:Ca2+-binding RTX toxin-like protein n=1 Tax=Aliiruegeria haliotis TaxID=1280846 RepID=A0A2T0RVX7_9RHOB|nr:calcium-binding protein [Aliiruegeria haliotis]PRY25331.1 Ca2+-binding RTX toxin-like protein [Aliiruegeria haliotis]
MNDQSNTPSAGVGIDSTPEHLQDLITLAREGATVAGFSVIPPSDEPTILPEDTLTSRVLLLGDHIVLATDTGHVIVLLDGAISDSKIEIGEQELSTRDLRVAGNETGEWSTLASAPVKNLTEYAGAARDLGSGGTLPVQAGDPLIGLKISPLQLFTEYPPTPDRDEYRGLQTSPAVPLITIADLLRGDETDAALMLSPSEVVTLSLEGTAVGETICDVTFLLDGLPAGTTVSSGVLTDAGDGTLSLRFSGSPSAFEGLVITFPTDFSTDSRNDYPEGNLVATLEVKTNLGDATSATMEIRVAPEGDVEIDDTLPDTVADETDATTAVVPGALLDPAATDIDGSETIIKLVLTIAGLPGDGSFSTSSGISGLPSGAILNFFIAADGSGTLTITLDAASVGDVVAAYKAIGLRLPADFSTANRSDLTGNDPDGPTSLPLTLTLTAITDEDQNLGDDTDTDGQSTVSRVVDIDFEADITLDAPSRVEGIEDGGVLGSPAPGVTVDLDIAIAVTDADGSETASTADSRFTTVVEITFAGLPRGASVNTGTLSGKTWTGSVAEAEQLELTLPGNFSGEITHTIVATTPEGSVSTDQVIYIEPRPDIDVDGVVNVDETDDRVDVLISDFVDVLVTDPNETVVEVTFTLPGLPPGALAYDQTTGQSVGSFTDAGNGTVIFVYTWTAGATDFADVVLSFPTDYSTTSPVSTLIADLTVTTEENGTRLDPVTGQIQVHIVEEGDVAIDDTLPDTVPDETDGPTALVPVDLLSPAATDLDSSESLERLTLVIEGLPGDGSFTLANGVSGLPSGAVVSLVKVADDSMTLTISMEASVVGDIGTAYAGIALKLPKDFSTANRTDLLGDDPDGPTELPITLTLTVSTDEDRNLSDDTANDGQATVSRVVDIDFEADINLSAKPVVTAREDDGVSGEPAPGVTVDLPISIDVTDIDGSETTSTADSRFTTVVEITFQGMPANAVFNRGTFSGDTWTGTVAEAEDLSVTLPGNFSGAIPALIRATTPEGTASAPQLIMITPTPDIEIDGEVITDETDAEVRVRLSDSIDVLVPDPDETVVEVAFTLPGLPPNMKAVDATTGQPVGTFIVAGNGTVTFSYIWNANGTGSATAPEDVTLVFPTDYSSTNPATTLVAKLTVTTEESGQLNTPVSGDIAVTVNYEGDIEIRGDGPSLIETDAPITFAPGAYLSPTATDLDGSESVIAVTLDLQGLPDGTRVSYDGGASFSALGGSALTFIGTLDEYNALRVKLPRDFSTENPATTIAGTVSGLTDEGGLESRDFEVVVAATPDVTVVAPALITDAEDGDGIDGGGVTVDLQIVADPNDIDGSEDNTLVEIAFTGLPLGTTASTGTLDAAAGTWSGTVAQVNSLSLTLPGDYSGDIDLTITATSPEGVATTTQRIEIAPAGDVDLDIVELVTAETDDIVLVTPSDAWQVSVSDFDPNDPREVLTEVSLTLDGLPPGVLVQGVPASTITYDTLSGGTFTFVGTADQYAALKLWFPADYSTESPTADGLTITGTLAATSTEGSNGPSGVVLRITPEGDVEIDDTMPDTVADETDGPTALVPVDLLAPAVTDNDGSESLSRLVLVIAGLPGDGSFTIANGVTGLPNGAQATLTSALDGSSTLTITLLASQVGDVGAAYSGLALELPTDFSTANRSDLTGTDPDGPTQLPITLTLTVETDEDQDLTDDTAVDGQVTASRVVDIDFEADIALSAQDVVTAREDGGFIGDPAPGVEVDLPISIAITDLDGSETASTADSRFTTVVEITFQGMPATATFNGGSFAGDTWTGTVAEAENLSVKLPGNFSGSIPSLVRATTPEGTAAAPQLIVITPVPDVTVDGEIRTRETDAPVEVLISDFVDVLVTDPDETIEEITFILPGLPPNMRAVDDTTGLPVGTFTDAGNGTVIFSYIWKSDGSASGTSPDDVKLIFPKDYSSTNPLTTLVADLTVTTRENGQLNTPVSADIAVTVDFEGDVEIQGTNPVFDETDDPIVVTLTNFLNPVATDVDGSENVIAVTLSLDGLPAGARVSYDGGGTFAPVGASGTITFIGTLAEYRDVQIELPADFSTENPATTISGTLSGLTDEAGLDSKDFRIVINATQDVTVDAPALLTDDEDGDGIDGGGVTVDLQLNVAPNDIDGSEDNTLVEITFTDLPLGTTASNGTLDDAAGIWTGTVADANALALHLPGDYSGDIDLSIRATSPEGVASTTQRIEIAPTGDVDLDIVELTAAETDDFVFVTPSTAWQVSISDFDPNTPREVMQQVDLTLDDLPPGVVVNGVPAGTFSYDFVNGGTLAFTGTEAEYNALELRFPVDYSTESPAADGLTINGTLTATSNEGSNGPANVVLRITPEGDVELDDTLPDTVPDETDAPTALVPVQLLAAAATDLDLSESLDRLVFVVAGLPGDGSFTINNGVSGLPAGATTSLVTVADGSKTLTITLEASAVGDVSAAYAGIALELPKDFSTANRSDLAGSPPNGPTELPLTLTLTVVTDEDQDTGNDTAVDGQATATRVVDIDFEADIALSAAPVVQVREDGGFIGDPAPGVNVDLPISIDITDIDGSETASSADSRFAAVVEITFRGMPAGAVFNGGSYSGDTWTGTVAEAEALSVKLPGNYAGTIPAFIRVTTPEGTETAPQVLIVTPAPDVVIDGEIITTETDAEVAVRVSDFVDIIVTDPQETLAQISFTLPGLPPGMKAVDVNNPNTSVGTFTNAGNGTVTYNYLWNADGSGSPVSPDDVVLVFPKDYSSTNPATTLVADVTVRTEQMGQLLPPVSADVAVTVDFEGDIRIVDNGPVRLKETDDVVEFTPSAFLLPEATDIDGSESVALISLDFATLPNGTKVSYDNGATFVAATSNLGFIGDLGEYRDLIIQLPKDFSTENPASTLTGTLQAITDEGGVASATLDVSLDAEGDIEVTDNSPLVLQENDAPQDTDEDNTTSAPVDVKLVDAVTAQPSDSDGSESIARVDVVINGLPNGTELSTDGGTTFSSLPPGASYSTTLTMAEYRDLIFRLPDDFSTENPPTTIDGRVTFTTDEAILAGETDVDATDGIESRDFVVRVDSEADVDIDAKDYTGDEDQPPHKLDLDAMVTDIDGSESITDITVTFTNLPTNTDQYGQITLTTSETTYTIERTSTFTITVKDLTELQSLEFTAFPTHFSGIVTGTVNVKTDEGDPAGTDSDFEVRIRPDAEPELDVDIRVETGVENTNPDQYLVKEDVSFLLQIRGETPDQDGSEYLDQVEILHIPTGWITSDNSGNVDLSQFEAGTETGKIASATISTGTLGDTLIIQLVPDVVNFDANLRFTPLANDDRDQSTILVQNAADSLAINLHGIDTAAGLADDQATVVRKLDVDYDAVIDPMTITTGNRGTNENTNGKRNVNLGIRDFGLTDTDGSEVIDSLLLTLTVATESDTFNPPDPSDMRLQVATGSLRYAVDITLVGSTADSVTYEITQAAGATPEDFANGVEKLRLTFPQHFSGVVTTDGEVTWSETTTPTLFPGDVEVDTSDADNKGTDTFRTRVEVRPIAEAELTLTAFVRDDDLTTEDTIATSPTSVSGTAIDGATISIADILTLRESTADGSGPGTPQNGNDDQVEVYIGLDASTPDTDGSEELEQLRIANIPSAWVPLTWQVNGAVPQSEWSLLRTVDGSGQILASEFAKIDSITFDGTTGTVVITFKDDVTDFSAALPLTPSTYEDWDPSQTAPFGVIRPDGSFGTSQGTFHGGDIIVDIETRDDNTNRQVTETAEVVVDIDVDPINNTAFLVSQTDGNEAVIDNLPGGPSGIFDFQMVLDHVDKDVSEVISAVVIRSVPVGVSVYVNSRPGDPTSPYQPALITSINPDGTTDWSLEGGTWENMQFRGLPLHYAGEYPIDVDVVTKEWDGGGTRVTQIDMIVRVIPVADGGNPTGRGGGNEDTSFGVSISANIIDSAANLVGIDISSESVDRFRIVSNDFPRDSFGRPFLLFDGPPQIDTANPPDPTDPFNESGYLNLIDPTTWIDWSKVSDLHMLGGLDSNEDIDFQIEVEYVEDIDTSEFTTNIGTVRINMKGIADAPDVTVQQEDPDQTTGSTLVIGDVDPVYRATSTDTDGAGGEPPTAEQNFNRIYGYAGDDSAPFTLTQRFTDNALRNGYAGLDPSDVYEPATPLSGIMTETTAITGGTPFDGSEVIYYLISGIPAGASFLGVTPVDPTGSTVLVTELQLANLTFVPPAVSVVTYYDMDFNAIVLEDDVSLAAFRAARDMFSDPITGKLTDLDGFLKAVDGLPGGAVVTEDFSIVVLPESVGPGPDCPNEELLPPIISLEGNGFEDQQTEVKLVLSPNSQYDDILDLIDLPSVGTPPVNITGDLGIVLELPPGSSISADPPGAVIYDPISGGWAIDLAKLLSGNSAGDTVSAGSIFYTPPAHESSPVNPFPFGETFGSADPYDNLPEIEVSMVLNNITCGTSTTGTGTSNVFIEPVVDGPTVDVILTSQAPAGIYPYPVPEDEPIGLDIKVSGVDGGERLLPGSGVVITINGSHIGGQLSDLDKQLGLQQSGLYDRNGNIIDDGRLQIVGGDYVYTLDESQLDGLYIIPKNHIHGDLTVSVEATAEDIDFSTKTGTGNGTIYIDAIADEPVVDVDETVLDPETGLPIATINDNGTPLNPFDDFIELTYIEDQKIFLQQIAPAFTPDMDNSEVVSAVFELIDGVEIGATSPLTSLIDNGDGTYTVNADDFDKIWFKLEDEHARTPDNLDPSIPVEFPVTVKFITYELSNGDQKEFDAEYFVRVRPDADKPTVAASIAPKTGTEDQPGSYVLTMSGATPDPHETMDFQISGIPAGGTILLNGGPVTVTPAGTATIPGVPGVSVTGSYGFEPAGTVEFIPPADFAGSVTLTVVSITTDDVPAPWDTDGYVDQEPSDPVDLMIDIDVAPDLVVSATQPAVVLDETDDVVTYTPDASFDIRSTDVDGSEFVDSIRYQFNNMPAGVTYQYSLNGTVVDQTGDLDLTGLSQADFATLQILLPKDFSTDGQPDLQGVVTATTNEGGSGSASNTIAVNFEEDLDFSVDTDPVQLVETDAPLPFKPADALTLDVTDIDGSEVIDTVTFAMAGLPDGTTYSTGGAATPVSGTLNWSGTGAEFDNLVITFPTDFATNGTPLTATVSATTNEGGSDGGSFDVEIAGELDFDVSVSPSQNTTILPLPQVLELGIAANVTDTQTTPSETFEEVVIVFDAPLPTSAVPSSGTLVNGRTMLILTRGPTDPATFAATVAALSITFDKDFQDLVSGRVVGATNHGTALPVDFAITMTGNGPTGPQPSFLSMTVLSDEDLIPSVVPEAAVVTSLRDSGDDLELDGRVYSRMADNVGGQVTVDISLANNGDNAVERSDDSAFSGIDGFHMQGGDDLVDLDGSSAGMTVWLGAGDDVATGSAGDDIIRGGAGRDVIDGRAGDDALHGGSGSDVLSGGRGDDSLWGNDASDSLFGGRGSDTLRGGADDDRLEGETGGDALYGDMGADRLIGAAGNDLLVGGDGADDLSGGTGKDRLFGGRGEDVLEGGDASDMLFGANGADSLRGGQGADELHGGRNGDTLAGGAGNDLVYGGRGRDVLDGNVDDDSLFGGRYGDTLRGGQGNDVLKGNRGDDALKGGPGNDTLKAGLGNDSLKGGRGDDLLAGAQDDDVLEGWTGDDILRGGDGADVLRGHDGNDILRGGRGGDTLFGDAGDDVLIGGPDGDVMTGGTGSDIFRIGNDLAMTDVIADYQGPEGGSSHDQIDLTAFGLDASFAYDKSTGELSVNGAVVAAVTGFDGGVPDEVEVIFETASNQAATSVI